MEIRQDRLSIGAEKILLEIEGEKFSVFDYSTSGISIVGDFGKIGSSYLAKIYYDSTLLKTFSLKKVRSQSSDKQIRTCFESNEPILTDYLEGYHACDDLFENIELQSKSIPSWFKSATLTLKKKLDDLKNSLESIDSDFKSESFKNGVIERSFFYLNDLMGGFYSSFLEHKMTDDETRECFKYFREEIGFIYKAPAAKRFLMKPLKYAGDYEMMNIIYKNENEGDSLFSKMVHHYCINHPNAKAVRNRIDYLSKKIISLIGNKEVHALSLACGPAEEITYIIRDLDQKNLNNLNIHLLDQDKNAIHYADRNIRRACFENNKFLKPNFIHQKIARFAMSNNAPKFDIIYSAGLFDYFDDEAAKKIAKSVFSLLKPGGKMILGNFDDLPMHKLFMETIFDWELIYRTKEHLLNLYSQVSKKVTIEQEPEGVNLFAVITNE